MRMASMSFSQASMMALPTMTWLRLPPAPPLSGDVPVSFMSRLICSMAMPMGRSASWAVPSVPPSEPWPWSSQVL